MPNFKIATKGRPKGTTKPEVKVLTPENQEGFMKLRRGQRMQAPVLEAKAKAEKDRARNLLRTKLQSRYYHEFEEIEWVTAGVIKEHPRLKLLGRVLELYRSTRGEKLLEQYFPERYTEEFRKRKIQRMRNRIRKLGITAHELRMKGVEEALIRELFNK
jgi:hypothetical protein